MFLHRGQQRRGSGSRSPTRGKRSSAWPERTGLRPADPAGEHDEMAGYVNVRAYAELNDFLGRESRGLTVRRPFRTRQTVKDVLEAMGIPHTEVDLILVKGD